MATNTRHSADDNPPVREIHCSKIFAHHAKTGYNYPTIHLPLAFSGLIGLRTRIYQTLHEGALAFLVVVLPSGPKSENAAESPKRPVDSLRKLQSNQLVQLFEELYFSSFRNRRSSGNIMAPTHSSNCVSSVAHSSC